MKEDFKNYLICCFGITLFLIVAQVLYMRLLPWRAWLLFIGLYALGGLFVWLFRDK